MRYKFVSDEIYSPCPSCTKLWYFFDLKKPIKFSQYNVISYKSKSYDFYFHPACLAQHKKIISKKNKFKSSNFSFVKKIDTFYSKKLKMHFSNSSGLFSINDYEFIKLSGQGRDVSRDLSIKKSIFELIERMSTVYLSLDKLMRKNIKGIRLKQKKYCYLPVSKVIPNGLYNQKENPLPLSFGVSVHESFGFAKRSAIFECIEKNEQYNSLNGQKLRKIENKKLKKNITKIINSISSSKTQINIYFRNLKTCFFIVCYLKQKKYPYQLLTSSVSVKKEDAIKHALYELYEKESYLQRVYKKIKNIDENIYPWFEYARNQKAFDLEKLFEKGNRNIKNKYDNLVSVNRSNLLTEQINISICQVVYPYNRKPLGLKYYPYG